MVNYLDAIEELAKSSNLRNGELGLFTEQLLSKSAELLVCERVNAWLFNEDTTELQSLKAFDLRTGLFNVESPLRRHELPNYFKHLTKNSLIVSSDAMGEPMNEELLETYLKPNDVLSMIDVPLRSGGEMIGVVCFEKIGKRHDWSLNEISYTQSVAQLLSLGLETKNKKEYREELEKLVHQKEILLAEINHRVKNNLAIIVSLINIQKYKSRDDVHEKLFEEVRDKVYSMSLIQQQLHDKQSVDEIDLSEYLRHLIQNLCNSYDVDGRVKLSLDLDNHMIDVTKAIPLGLIANEALTNSFKYGFNQKNLFPELKVSFNREEAGLRLVISDNGPGFDSECDQHTGMGLELIKDLSSQIDADLSLVTDNGVTYKLSL